MPYCPSSTVQPCIMSFMSTCQPNVQTLLEFLHLRLNLAAREAWSIWDQNLKEKLWLLNSYTWVYNYGYTFLALSATKMSNSYSKGCEPAVVVSFPFLFSPTNGHAGKDLTESTKIRGSCHLCSSRGTTGWYSHIIAYFPSLPFGSPQFLLSYELFTWLKCML